MKTQQFVPIALAVGLGAIALTTTAAPAAPGRQTPYTIVEDTMVFTQPGTWFYGLDNRIYIRGVEMTAEDRLPPPGDNSPVDERLVGTVTLTFDAIWESVNLVGPIWAYVKLENHHDDTAKNGWWEGYCFGARELMEDGQVQSWFEGTIEGRGIHEGLIARYWYDGVDVMHTLTLYAHGYVVERGAPVRPLKVQGTRTDSFKVVFGFEMEPFGAPNLDAPSAIGLWEIKQCAESVSHLGKTTEFGFGMFDVLGDDPRGTGMGYTLAPNGDKLYWVAEVDVNPGENNVATLNFAGGTGRLEAAVGGFTAEVKYEVTGDEMNLSYRAEDGLIRY